MLSSPGRYFALLLLGTTIALPLRSEETPSAKQPTATKTTSAEKKPVPAPTPSTGGKKTIDLKKMDFSALPADAIVVVCERVAETLQLVPNSVIMTPGKYQKMLEEIERLKKLVQLDKPTAPSKCHLKGKVERKAVELEVRFEGRTDRPNTIVALACPQAGAYFAQIEGRVPQIDRSEAGGFTVKIEKAGSYELTLKLCVPLTAREGNAHGFELTLPHAAITTLDLDLPANIKDVRVGGRPLSDSELAGLTLKNQHLSGNPSFKSVDKLDLAWKEVHPPSGVRVLTAEGRIQVRVHDAGLTTEAELTLKVEGALTDVWSLLVPLGADVKVVPPDDARVKPKIEKTDKQFASLRAIRLKEPSADPLHVLVTVRTPLPRSGSLAPIGPFFVVGAARQTGTVLVRNQVRKLHLYYHERGDMKARQITDPPASEAAGVVKEFTYGNIPQVEKPKDFTGLSSLSWLDLEAETVNTQARTRVTHTLKLQLPPLASGGAGVPPVQTIPDRRDAGSSGDKAESAERHWDIVTTITPATKWTDLEQLKILVPPEWSSTEDGVQATSDKNTHSVTIRSFILQREGSVRLAGRYQPIFKSEGHTVLKLPRPQGVVEQCEVKIEVPRDSEVVLNNTDKADLEFVKQTGPHEQTWRFRNVPVELPGIDLSWRPYRPELVVTSVADVTLHGDRADVRQEMRFQSPQNLPASIGLRVPAAAGDSLKVQAGGRLAPLDSSAVNPRGRLRLVALEKTGQTDCRLFVDYSMTLADKGRALRAGESFLVPLVTPEQATRCETKVRVWSKAGFLPLPAIGSPWDEQNIEEVKKRSELPLLVLQTHRLDAPLMLRAAEQSASFTVLVERALVRVELLDNGGQIYRASYQLRQLVGQELDIELPGPVPTLNARIALNHQRVMPDIVDEKNQRTDGGSIARLRLNPDLVRQTALLEVSYQLPSGRTGISPLRTTLSPPHLRGAPAVPTRWQVSVPPNRVLIAPESGAGLERTWTRRGWLLAARLNRTDADLEREFEKWLPDSLHSDDERLDHEAQTTPALVCWQDHVEPMTLTHAPQQAWLLVCSLGLLIPGWGLYWLARPHTGGTGRMAAWFWPILAVATLAAAIGILFWPTTMWAIVYGCEPGALVLLCVVVLQWLVHRRYRRQIVFLPSFSRSRPGSSLLRRSAAPRPSNGEPSTVDAPPPSVSSQ
ncbi:MAG TPA: hypothetical protein VN688_26625 [Gemmataceae bacterium]|nr:hypothetical protein [Gemmataceae bacterium]